MPARRTKAGPWVTRAVAVVATLCLAWPALANAPSETENADFKKAVTAVKNKDYLTALGLFEIQAKNARHDAQYNMAVLLHAGKGRPRNYTTALYWAWQAQLGGIEAAEDLADDIVDILPPKDVDDIRKRVQDALQARIDAKDIWAIPQLARYHTDIVEEADYVNAYIWYSIAAALNMPDAHDRRDDVEGELADKDLVDAQNKTAALFEKYNFTPLPAIVKGGKNGN